MYSNYYLVYLEWFSFWFHLQSFMCLRVNVSRNIFLLVVRPEVKTDASAVFLGKIHIHVGCDKHCYITSQDWIHIRGLSLITRHIFASERRGLLSHLKRLYGLFHTHKDNKNL